MVTRKDIDVLIVGAGPVGLTLANELCRRGLSCRIIDQKMAPAQSSRALGVFNRTLEIFGYMGVAEQVLSQAQKARFMTIYAGGKRLLQLGLQTNIFETPFEFPAFCSQVHVEQVLRNNLTHYGMQVEWGVELTSFIQDDTGVTATMRQSGETPEMRQAVEQQIHAQWLVGCDGAHSRVRKQLELPFPGAPDETWLVVDVDLDWSLSKSSLYAFLSPEGTVVAFPFPEGKRWRLLDTVIDENIDGVNVAARLTHKITSVFHDESVIVPEPSWISKFTIQQRHVPIMRAGHCFVVGDAAHVHSPASGQGMNTGIQDAFNLAWKLALVTKGLANARLLDSFSAEREPIAEKVLQGARTFTRIIGRNELLVQNVRNLLLFVVGKLPAAYRFLARKATVMLSELALAYTNSSIIAENWQTSETSQNKRAGKQGVAPGTRVPDIHFGNAGTQHIFALLDGLQHTILLFSGSQANENDVRRLVALAQQFKQRYSEWLNLYVIVASQQEHQFKDVDDIVLDQEDILHHRFGVQESALYLIRPDGYIGYRSQPVQESSFERYVTDVLGMQGVAMKITR